MGKTARSIVGIFLLVGGLAALSPLFGSGSKALDPPATKRKRFWPGAVLLVLLLLLFFIGGVWLAGGASVVGAALVAISAAIGALRLHWDQSGRAAKKSSYDKEVAFVSLGAALLAGAEASPYVKVFLGLLTSGVFVN